MEDLEDLSEDKEDLREEPSDTTKEERNAGYVESMDICLKITHNQFVIYVTKLDMRR